MCVFCNFICKQLLMGTAQFQSSQSMGREVMGGEMCCLCVCVREIMERESYVIQLIRLCDFVVFHV